MNARSGGYGLCPHQASSTGRQESSADVSNASAADGPLDPGSYACGAAAFAQQRIDDAPSFEHAILAREQRRVAVQCRADQPLVGADLVGARVADEELEVAALHLGAGSLRGRAERDRHAVGP